MSLYNSLFGVNANSIEILSLIGLKQDFFARFRDVDLINKGETVRVFTRTGGGNREDYEDNWQEIRENSNYIADYDDDFDNTYAYIEFKVPADKLEKAKALFAGEPESFEDKFIKSMEDMNNPNSKSYKVAENIAKQISEGIDSEGKGGIIFI